ncbi:MAG: nucleotide-diphospho-sugar transferase [Planctomycetota bacterium]
MIVCVHEDRERALAGVKLLILSLRRHCGEVPVMVSSPSPPSRFRSWLQAQRRVTLIDEPAFSGSGWNVKPSLLLRLLDSGEDDIIWLDSDIVCAGDFRPLVEGHGPATLVVSQAQYWDLYQGESLRTRLWGFEVGRAVSLVSTGILRVTPHHRDLLLAWQHLLAAAPYREAQERPLYERPIHMLGDQDVLTAILGSRRFAAIPVAYLKRGRDVAVTVGPAGYTIAERLRNLGRGLPRLIHCGGVRPWEAVARGGSLVRRIKSYYDRLYLELCPYTWVARQFHGEIEEELVGVDVRTLPGRLSRALSFDEPSLQGLPLAVFHAAGKRAKRLLGLNPWPRSKVLAGLHANGAGEELLRSMHHEQSDKVGKLS